MRRAVLLVWGVLQFCWAVPAFAVPCVSQSLPDYLSLGAGGCTVDGVTFDGFTALSPAGSATQIASNAVTLTPITGAGALGFAFSSGTAIAAGPGDLFELWFGFRATAAGGSGLTGNTIVLGAPTVTGDGAITIVEQKCLEGAYDTTTGLCGSGTPLDQIVFAIEGDSDLEETATFAPASFFDVFIDLVVDGGLSGRAELGPQLGEFRLASNATTIPEPATVALLGFALLSLATSRRFSRRRR